jgi:hypothetical protein
MPPSKTQHWLALCDHLEMVYRARDHPGVAAAFLALATFDHTLTIPERLTARLARWARDTPDIPVPKIKERAWWGRCLCHACAVARTLHSSPTTPRK